MDAYLAPVALIHPEVRFRYRPMHIIERAVFHENTSKMSEQAITTMMSETLAARVISWSITEPKDGIRQPLALTPVNFRRLEPVLFFKFVDMVIWGSSRGQVDPKAKQEEVDKRVKEELQAAIAGIPMMDSIAEEREKNSEPV